MITALHPWDTLRRAGALLLAQRTLWPMALVLGFTQSAGLLTSRATPGRTPAAGELAWTCLSALLIVGLAILSLAATIALLVLATDRAQGGALPPGAAWRQGWARWWPTFVFGLLLGLYVALPVLVLLLVALLLFGTGFATPGLSVWTSVATLLLGILIAPVSGLGECRVGVAWQTPSAGLRRAWALFRAQSGPLLGLALLLGLIPGLLGLLPTLLLTLTPLGTPAGLLWRVLLWPVLAVVLGFLGSWALVGWALAHLTLDPPPAPLPLPAPLPPPPCRRCRGRPGRACAPLASLWC